MATILTCPQCNRDYDVSRLKPSTKLKCKGCSKILVVPDDKVITCVNCSQIFRATRVTSGTRFKCSKCNTLMEIDSDGKPFKASEKRVELKVKKSGARKDTVFADKDYKADVRAQDSTQPPSSRRFGVQEEEPELDELFKKSGIIAAFLLDDDGILFSAHSQKKYDAEILSNSTVFLRKISTFLKKDFGLSENGTCSLSMSKGELRLKAIGDRNFALIVNKKYDGAFDKKIIKALEEKE